MLEGVFVSTDLETWKANLNIFVRGFAFFAKTVDFKFVKVDGQALKQNCILERKLKSVICLKHGQLSAFYTDLSSIFSAPLHRSK